MSRKPDMLLPLVIKELANKLTAVIDGEDQERLCGISRDTTGRSRLIFAEPTGTPKFFPTVVYVDAVLTLAKMLKGEVRHD